MTKQEFDTLTEVYYNDLRGLAWSVDKDNKEDLLHDTVMEILKRKSYVGIVLKKEKQDFINFVYWFLKRMNVHRTRRELRREVSVLVYQKKYSLLEAWREVGEPKNINYIKFLKFIRWPIV